MWLLLCMKIEKQKNNTVRQQLSLVSDKIKTTTGKIVSKLYLTFQLNLFLHNKISFISLFIHITGYR